MSKSPENFIMNVKEFLPQHSSYHCYPLVSYRGFQTIVTKLTFGSFFTSLPENLTPQKKKNNNNNIEDLGSLEFKRTHHAHNFNLTFPAIFIDLYRVNTFRPWSSEAVNILWWDDGLHRKQDIST